MLCSAVLKNSLEFPETGTRDAILVIIRGCSRSLCLPLACVIRLLFVRTLRNTEKGAVTSENYFALNSTHSVIDIAAQSGRSVCKGVREAPTCPANLACIGQGYLAR
jgi:hypothetical protein